MQNKDKRKKKEGEKNTDEDADNIFDWLEVGATGAAGATGGPVAAMGTAAGIEIARKIPWDKIFKGIEDGVEAKKEKDIWKGIVAAWEEIGGKKDLLINSLVNPDPNWSAEKKQAIIDELKPKLTQMQIIAADARKKLDNGDKDGARQQLKNLLGLLKQLREWIRQNI